MNSKYVMYVMYMFRNNLLRVVNVYYRKEIKVIYYTLPGCSHWLETCLPLTKLGENGEKLLQEDNDKMKINPDW